MNSLKSIVPSPFKSWELNCFSKDSSLKSPFPKDFLTLFIWALLSLFSIITFLFCVYFTVKEIKKIFQEKINIDYNEIALTYDGK